jgi:acetolactate synthase I/II/III large subunit
LLEKVLGERERQTEASTPGVIQPAGEMVLLVSGCNANSGGLFRLDAAGVTTIDRLSTHGLAMRGDRLYRVMGCREHARLASDLLTYDQAGVRRFDRLDGVGDPHDVLPRDGHVVISSSTENAIYVIRDDGEKTTLWQAAAPEDAWHVNCLTEVDGELYGTAFGIFDQHRAWLREPLAPTGILMRFPSEEIVLGGLTQPHTPRRLGRAWLVCNSARNELAAYDAKGALLQCRQLSGYTRGIAFDDRYLYIGESANRHLNSGAEQVSRITILDRSDWSVVDAYQVDMAEIYDVLLVPKALAEGAAIGFRTNPTRVEQQDQLAMFAAIGVQPRRLWAIGEPLPPKSLRASFEAEIPASAKVNEVFILPCRVTNAGDAIFVSAPPNPVQFCYRWFNLLGRPVGEGEWIHTPLPHSLLPGQTMEAAVRIAAPHAPGRYTLAVTLLQEGIAWFDDLSPESGVRGPVRVALQ